MHSSNHSLVKLGIGIAAMYVGFASSTGFTAGTEVQIGTLPSSVKPAVGTVLGVASSYNCEARVNTSGSIYVRPYINVPANSYLFLGGLFFV